jgi:hypothetical protein
MREIREEAYKGTLIVVSGTPTARLDERIGLNASAGQVAHAGRRNLADFSLEIKLRRLQ